MASLKRISLKDIATAAGVSPALASFVLNGKGKEYRVNEETAQRILKIANDLNYQPNLAAKSLRSGRTKTIGLVVSDISNPFFSQLSNLINKGVDGLIVVPCENSEKYMSSLANNSIPVVLFDRYFPDLNISYVALNNYGAAYTATRHLLSSGYESPCIVAYDINLIHMKDRVRGYKQAMEEAGKKKQVTVLYLKQDSLRKSAERILPKALENGTDAFLFGTNMISLACLYVLKEMQDIDLHKLGLVGFDGSPVFDFFCVPISYVQQPVSMLVQKALEILIDNITNGNAVQSVLAEGVFVDMSK